MYRHGSPWWWRVVEALGIVLLVAIGAGIIADALTPAAPSLVALMVLILVLAFALGDGRYR